MGDKKIGKYSVIILALLIVGLPFAPLLIQAPGVMAQTTGLLPGAIQVATQGTRNVTSNSALLMGALTSVGGHPSVQVAFEWGTSPSYGHQTPFQTMNSAGSYSANVIGLSAGTTYNFRAVALAGLGSQPAYGSNMTFTTPATHPIAVQTSGATQVSQTSYVLHGDLLSKGPYSEVNLWFDWGASTSYGNSTPPQRFTDAAGPFSSTISGLAAGTTYHFRAAASGTALGSPVTYGANMILTTPSPKPIVVNTQSATGVTASSATLNGYVASTGGHSTVIVFFEWGTTTSYGNITPQSEHGSGAFNATLSGLSTGVTYHYRAVAMAAPAGATPVRGSDVTFTTSALTVSTGTASSVSRTTATLNGSLQSTGGLPSVDLHFEYGETTAYGKTTPVQRAYSPGTFSARVTDLTPGITYHFRAVATSGTVSPAYGTDSSFKTSTETLSITTGSTSGVTATTATLTGSLTSLGSYTSAEAWFEWGTDTSLSNSTPRQPMMAPGIYSATLYGLISGMTYYYRAAARAPMPGAPIAYGAVNIFTSTAQRTLNVITENAEGISATSATLNGMVISTGAGLPVQVWFEYGTSLPYSLSVPAGNLNTTGNFNTYISGLQPNTTYHFRAGASGPPGSTPVYGADVSFTTTSQSIVAVSTLDPTEVTPNSAKLNGYLNSLGQYSQAQVWFEWGTDMGYGNFTQAVTLSSPGKLSTVITGLKPGITYHFRTGARAGGVTAYGTDEAFATSAGSPPKVSTEPVSKLQGNTATLNGQLVSLGDQQSAQVWFEWGTTTSYGNSTLPKVMSAPGPFESEITGLAVGTTYHYRAVVSGTGSGATPISGPDTAFSTAPGPSKPSLSITTGPASNLTSNSVVISGGMPSLGDLKSAQVYFEWGISSAYGNATPPQTITRADAFTATLTNLNPGTTYHYRAVAIGPTGPVQGSDVTFTTPQEQVFGLFSCSRR